MFTHNFHHILILITTGALLVYAPISYVCPPNCDCQNSREAPDDVYTACNINTMDISQDGFPRVPVNHTRGIIFICQNSDIAGRLTSGTFSAYEHLDLLSFIDCNIQDIEKDAFTGLVSLELLIFTRCTIISVNERALLKLYNLRKFEAYATNVFLPRDALCNLKYLQTVNFTSSFQNTFAHAGLECQSPMRSMQMLEFTNNQLERLPHNFSELFPDIKHVYLEGNKITEITPNMFSNLPHLAHLNLMENYVKDLPQNFLHNCPSVSGLLLSHNFISHLPRGFLQNCSSMLYFGIGQNPIGDSVWEEIKNCINLKVIYLGLMGLTLIRPDILANFRYLEHIYLTGNSIRQIPNRAFEHQTDLVGLWLNKNKLSKLHRTTFSGLRNLNILNVEENQLVYIHNEAFRPFAQTLTDFNVSNNRLSEVPEAIRNLQALGFIDLYNNSISVIESGSFKGLDALYGIRLENNQLHSLPGHGFSGSPNIQILNLAHNNIQEIETSAFYGLHKLSFLRLNYNRISDIRQIFAHTPNLGMLWLEHNNIAHPLDPDIFPITVNTLSLSYNKIPLIKPYTFTNLNKLALLDLGDNSITTMEELALRMSVNLASSVHVYMSRNPFSCTCHLQWLHNLITGASSTQVVNVLIIQGVTIMCLSPPVLRYKLLPRINSSQLICDYRVHCNNDCPCCDVNLCYCKYACPRGCSCFHTSDFGRHVIDCSRANITKVPEHLPINVRSLYLNVNKLNYLKRHQFFGLQMLTELFLNHTQLSGIENKTFESLHSLKLLMLDNNQIEYIHSSAFQDLESLESLFLHNNKLRFLEPETFYNLKSLRKLTLNGNNFILFDDEFRHVLSQLPGAVLSLADNAWSCSCDSVEHFSAYILSNAERIHDESSITCQDTTEAECSEEQNLRLISDVNGSVCRNISLNLFMDEFEIRCPNSSLDGNYTVSHFQDRLPDTTVRVLIAAVSVCFVLILVSVLCYLYRIQVKLFVFSHFGVRFTKSTPEVYSLGKIFDAFVSYSSKDEEYITHTLAPTLENKKPASYKLCLHYRDFPVGASIAESIVEAVEASKRTILVLSNNFLDSEWCRYEFQSAHHQALRDSENKVIVLLLDDLNKDKIDVDLKHYLKTNTYLKVDDPWFWEKLYYALPDIESLAAQQKNGSVIRNRNAPNIDEFLLNNDTQEVSIVFGGS